MSSRSSAKLLSWLSFGILEKINNKINSRFYIFFTAARKPEAIVLRVRENSALQGRIIISLLADSELMCALKCLNTVSCFSFNYKSNGQTCELNHANKLTSPFDLIWDLDSVYYEMVFTSGKQY